MSKKKKRQFVAQDDMDLLDVEHRIREFDEEEGSAILPSKKRVKRNRSDNNREWVKKRQQENERLKRKRLEAENALFNKEGADVETQRLMLL